MRLFIIDGMALLFRSYYAMLSTPLSSKEGEPTGATYGFIAGVLRILETQKPDAIAVAWDSAEATFRHLQYSDYKANRPEFPPEMVPQLERTMQLLDAMNIKQLKQSGIEADDIAGTLAKAASKLGHKVFCVTQDKDFMQLVDDHISIYRFARFGNDTEIISYAEVEKKFGVHPDKVIDVLAIIGDSSDNVPGIKGVGEKTAIPLVQKYGSLENIYNSLGEISKASLRTKFEEGREMAFLSKELVTIKTDVELSCQPEDLITQKPNLELVIKIFQRLGFNSLLKRIYTNYPEALQAAENIGLQGIVGAGAEEKKVEKKSEIEQREKNATEDPTNLYPVAKILETINSRDYNYKTVKSIQELEQTLQYLSGFTDLCFDTETDSLGSEANIIGVSFSVKQQEAFYIPISLEYRVETQGSGTLFVIEETRQSEGLPLEIVLEKIKPILENSSINKIAHNAKFDMLLLKRYGIDVYPIGFDTMVAGYIDDSTQEMKMDSMSAKYLNYQPIPITELIGEKGVNQKSMKEISLDIVSEYACEDADITFGLYEKLKPILEQENLWHLAQNYDFPLIEVLAKMESIGVAVDTNALSEISYILEQTAKALQNDIYELAGREFVISSPKQLAEILFNELKLPTAKKTKTGFSTDQFVLEELAEIHALPEKILEYRQALKLKNTYVDALPALINKRTNRLHTSYNQASVSTGRLSSNNPNLQNIPIRSSMGREIRKAFIPGKPDYILLSADYSQIELRIMAYVCGDSAMIEAFKSNQDIHATTAMQVFGVGVNEVTPNMRRKAKEVNFGIMYGIGAFGLARRLKISRSEASDIIKSYFAKFPGVQRYMSETIEQARSQGFVQTLSGRRRKYTNINARNASLRAADERAAINMPIQGTASDIIRKAMIDIHHDLPKNFPQANMLLQVHDELIFEAPKELANELAQFVKFKMENAFSLGEVPLLVETGTGNNWYESHQ